MPTTYFGDILSLGTPELIVILVILILLFGGKKLPELARSLGSSIKELRKGVNDGKEKPSANTGSSDKVQ